MKFSLLKTYFIFLNHDKTNMTYCLAHADIVHQLKQRHSGSPRINILIVEHAST